MSSQLGLTGFCNSTGPTKQIQNSNSKYNIGNFSWIHTLVDRLCSSLTNWQTNEWSDQKQRNKQLAKESNRRTLDTMDRMKVRYQPFQLHFQHAVCLRYWTLVMPMVRCAHCGFQRQTWGTYSKSFRFPSHIKHRGEKYATLPGTPTNNQGCGQAASKENKNRTFQLITFEVTCSSPLLKDHAKAIVFKGVHLHQGHTGTEQSLLSVWDVMTLYW